MYCASCGNLINPDLNYCNRCGTKISAAIKELGEKQRQSGSGLGPVTYIACAGLICFVVVLRMLMRGGASESALVGVTFLYMTALVSICFLAIHSAKKTAGIKAAPQTDFSSDYETGELDRSAAHQLNAAYTPPVSVTEYTTRHLNKVPVRDREKPH